MATRFVNIILLLIVACSSFISQAQPSFSRGEQRLPITFSTCMARADGALRAEGFQNVYTQANMAYGHKGINTAIILCNEATNNSHWVNIVVAATTGDGGIPGAERVRLQARMNNPNQPSINNSGGCPRSNTYGLSITPSSARVGQTVKIRYIYPGDKPGSGDWIGCFYPNTKQSYTGFWTYLTRVNGCEYDFVVPSVNPGPMQFRYILEGGYDKIMATAEFVVLP